MEQNTLSLMLDVPVEGYVPPEGPPEPKPKPPEEGAGFPPWGILAGVAALVLMERNEA